MKYIIYNQADLYDFVKELNAAYSIDPVILDIRTRGIELNTTLYINFNVIIKTKQKTLISTADGSPVFSLGSGCTLFILDGSQGKIILSGSDSLKNTNGGAITSASETSSMILKGVEINRSRAEYGGAIYTNGSLLLDKVVIKNNRALVMGGGLYVGKNLTIKKSLIENNHVSHDNPQGFGGAVFVEAGDLYIDKSVLKKNSSYSVGCLMLREGTLTIERSKIENNRSFAPFPQGGTVFLVKGKIYINKSKILNNKTVGLWSGGVVSVFGDVSAKDSEFSGNECNGPGGAIAVNFVDRLEVVRCVIKNNTASAIGAAVVSFSPMGEIYIADSLIKHNRLTNNLTLGKMFDGFMSEGQSFGTQLAILLFEKVLSRYDIVGGIGGIIATLAGVTIVNTKFIGNQIQGKKGVAIGGLFLLGRKNTISRSIFRGNSVEGKITKGSILYSVKRSILKQCVIKKNTFKASAQGLGTIYINQGITSIEDSVIASNKATSGAGAFIGKKAKLILKKSRITFNRARFVGGGIYVAGEFVDKEGVVKFNYPDNIHIEARCRNCREGQFLQG